MDQAPRLAAALAGLAMLWAGAAQASVISDTPDPLPPEGVLAGSGEAGCFPAAGVCAGSGRLSYSDVVSSFDAAGQELKFSAVFTVPILSDPDLNALGTAVLSGDGSVTVFGRTDPTELGSWKTRLTSLDLTGSFMGVPLEVVLDTDPGKESVGETTIASFGNRFEVTSFFDVFVDVTLSTTPPLMTGRGPLRAELVPAPEPAGLALVVLPLAVLAALRRRRQGGGLLFGNQTL